MEGQLRHPRNILEKLAAGIKSQWESQASGLTVFFDSSNCSPEAGPGGCNGLQAFDVGGSGRWKTCDCVIKELRRPQLERIETAYRGHSLGSFVPRSPEQAELLEIMRTENPSVYIWGESGKGKTAFGWMAFRAAIEAGRPAMVFLWRRLLFELEEYVTQKRDTLPIDLSVLDSREQRACIVINDLHASRVTTFVIDMLHMILDPVIGNDHQLIITSQLNSDDLFEHFNQVGEVRSVAVLRRILELNGMVEKGL